MPELDTGRILEAITHFFLGSADFNGISLDTLCERLAKPRDLVVDALKDLIARGLAGAIFSTTDVNPHIIRQGFEPIEVQLAKLETADQHACLYPRRRHLEAVVDASKLQGEPYKLELALGSAQLEFRVFDLSVLEVYRNDPRYDYSTDDIGGNITISTEHDESPTMKEADKVLLQTFGFCFDSDLNRAVAVFLRYLADLSSEHQLIWKARQLEGDFKLHPDYFDRSIRGGLGKGISLFDAFLLEQRAINEMSEAMGRPPFFSKSYPDGGRPARFSFLIRPTRKEYHDFVLILDQLMSDNINRDFFLGEIPYDQEEALPDGRVRLRRRGTIELLEAWLASWFQPSDPQPLDEMLAAFRTVRRERMVPAHKLENDLFDQQYVHQQRDLAIAAYAAIRTLRLILANHPQAKNVSIPSQLDGTIWTY